MTKKVTTMKLKVDLQCEKCYKKVKNVLCQFPHQVFDEKQDLVTIKVVCCSPERIRDQLCCKGCGAIKSIEIVQPPPDSDCKPCPDRKCCVSCYEGQPCGPCFEGCGPRQLVPPVVSTLVLGRTCCDSCWGGRPGGSCFGCCGGPPPRYGGYFYVWSSYGGARPCCVSRCDH
ncbi:uncharacterized protein LOC129284473 isoform X2 [Prosopis cineraria]|uniref:uncharacterized protein LOC129284473 isoform X2 n=1 Tax=Prosopis cineraria TaxID=364024 RepID=UPI00240F6CA1|nr:uncharacterized protein LOC129284473 isoform X2 [Prosopis cineraria]